jgi:hypothetical protein
MVGSLAHAYELHLVMQDATVVEAAATLFDAMTPAPWPPPTAWRTTISDEGEWHEQELHELPAVPALAPRASLEWRCGQLYNVAVYLKEGEPVATVIVNETAQEKAWRWLRAMEQVMERLLTANEVVVRHGIVRRSGPGVACVPRLPVVGTTTYVLAADDDLLNAGFEDAGAMIAAGGWRARTIEGCRLLSRAMHAETNLELLEAIQEGQWAMARLARPGLTDYRFHDPLPEEEPIFTEGEEHVLDVGYLEDEQVAVFSCAAGPGEHVQPWEIWKLGKALRDGKLPGGEVVREIRVGFPDRESAMRERRPLLDVGVTVQCYDEGGELITLPQDD